jgi:TonB-dependent receptor
MNTNNTGGAKNYGSHAMTERVYSARGVSLLVGVSTIALLATGMSAPAYAQAAPADASLVPVTASGAVQVSTPTQDAAPGSDATPSSTDIVVTGRRAALQSADLRKKNADTIIDSVVADEAGKLPDNSITEVLQRVAGVTIVRFAALNNPDQFSVEGSGIQVRGLSGVASRLNGREIFSANGGRAILWGDVTPELMSAVDVYKSSSADQIEGGTGGSVDLRTKLPFDYGYGIHVSGSGDISAGDLAKKTDYSMSGLVAGKWHTGIGDIGILLDGAYSQLSSKSDFFRMEPYFRTHINATDYFIPGGYDYGTQDFQRKRDGIYAALQWAPSDALRFTGIFFQSRYRNKSDAWGSFVTSQTLSVDPSSSKFDSNNGLLYSPAVFQRDPNTFLPSGGTITSGGNAGGYVSNTKTQDYSLAFDWAPKDSHVSAHGSFQHILSTSRTDSIDIFRDFNFPTSFGLDLRGALPVVSLPASFTPNLTDPSQYFWSAAMPHDENNRAAMNAANLDLAYTFDDSFLKSVKIGGRWSDRTERDLNNGYAWSALGRGWNGFDPGTYGPQLTYANAAPGDTELHVFDNFFHGAAVLPGNLLFPSASLVNRMMPIGAVAQLFAAPANGFCGPADWGNATYFNCTSQGPAATSAYGPGHGGRPFGYVLPDDLTAFSTRTLAGYAMVKFGNDVISGNAGARVVNVKNASNGYFQQFSNIFVRNGTTYTLSNVAAVRKDGAEFTRVLPAVNLTYSPSGAVKVRGAYNVTMDNASFSALSAAGSLGIATTTNPGCVGVPNCQLAPVFTNYTTNAGNPRLKPAMSNNFDLSFEWYPKGGSTLHLAAFYKRISSLPIYALTQQPVTVHFAGGTSEDALASASNAHNADTPATVKGIEVGGRWFFDKLPGALSGIGIEANYTFIDSKNPGDLYFDIFGVSHNDATLQGLSRHNFNATLLYEHNPFSLRLAYSWRSRYLQTTNANGTNPTYQYYSGAGTSAGTSISLPVYGDAYGTLDAGATIRVNKHFSFSIQGTNLLNSTARTLMGGYPNGMIYTRSWFQSDRRLSAGINFSF